jgi:hypothetical protein
MAKLADFGGWLLDIPEGSSGRLPFISEPWKAPKWAEYLTLECLLKTDVYSLGLIIWSAMAKDVPPALHVFDMPTATQDTTSWANHRLEAFMQLGRRKFAVEVDQSQVKTVLAVAFATRSIQKEPGHGIPNLTESITRLQ